MSKRLPLRFRTWRMQLQGPCFCSDHVPDTYSEKTSQFSRMRLLGSLTPYYCVVRALISETECPVLADQRPTAGSREPENSRTHVSLRGPTYHENSHAHHTWDALLHQTACFLGPEAPPVWVRFPSPAPIYSPLSARARALAHARTLSKHPNHSRSICAVMH